MGHSAHLGLGFQVQVAVPGRPSFPLAIGLPHCDLPPGLGLGRSALRTTGNSVLPVPLDAGGGSLLRWLLPSWMPLPLPGPASRIAPCAPRRSVPRVPITTCLCLCHVLMVKGCSSLSKVTASRSPSSSQSPWVLSAWLIPQGWGGI